MADTPSAATPTNGNGEDSPRAADTNYTKDSVLFGVLTALVVGLALVGVTKGAPVTTANYLLHALIIVACIVAVAKGAAWLVESAVRIANRMGVSEVVIGLTVVAFGTSAPEFAVSVSAGIQEHGSVSIGNVVGSNIFNLGFILGGVALISPVVVARRVVSRDGLALIASTVLLFVLLWNLQLEWFEGLFMFIGLIVYMTLLFVLRKKPEHKLKPVEPMASTTGHGHEIVTRMIFPSGRSGSTEPPEDFEIEEMPKEKATVIDFPIFIVGLAFVILGCHMLVDSALWYAYALEIPQWAIAVTVVAAGTSAPEMAVSIVAALKGHHEISAGNLIGSDMFNILGVLGLAAMLNVAITGKPLSIDESDRATESRPVSGQAEGADAGTAESEPIAMPPGSEAGKPPAGESDGGWNLVPAQWSLLTLIGMVILTVFFLWTGYRVSRLEGAILLGIALLRMLMDLRIINVW